MAGLGFENAAYYLSGSSNAQRAGAPYLFIHFALN
jgi:hypothetical protein